MTQAAGHSVRPLTPEDLDRVVDIDAQIIGRSRRGFFDKRLQAALADPKGIATIGTLDGDTLTGFAIARLQRGEYGEEDRVGVLDAMGVAPDSQHHGYGKSLIAGLVDNLRQRGARRLRTQVEWSDKTMTQFFSHNGFELAQRQVVECVEITRS